MTMPMIEARNLAKSFGDVKAVTSISLSVSKGEVLGFLGPNGAGKSTTMRMITGFLTPDHGESLICGHSVAERPVLAKQKMGYLPEGAPAYGDMTPFGFLSFMGTVRGIDPQHLALAIERVVKKTKIESVLHRPIDTLSKGFRRRVGLAQALIHDPDVLILDEPTDGLDPNQKFEVRKLIQEMAPEKAILVSTHILEEVEAVCTRAVIIAQGRIVLDGTPEDLLTYDPQFNSIKIPVFKNKVIEAKSLLSTSNLVDKLEVLETPNEEFASITLLPKGKNNITADIYRLTEGKGFVAGPLQTQRGRLDVVFRDVTHAKELQS